MITVFEWFGWVLSVSGLIYFMQMVVLWPFQRYRQYDTFDTARRITLGTAMACWLLIWAPSVYYAPVALASLPKGSMLSWIVVSFAFVVPAFWLLRMYLIRKLLRPPPTHPSRQYERL